MSNRLSLTYEVVKVGLTPFRLKNLSVVRATDFSFISEDAFSCQVNGFS